MNTILVLGGGIGGVVTAHELRKKLDRSKLYRIILFEKEENFSFAPSFLWAMVGKRKPSQLQSDFHPLSKRGIEIVKGKIQNVDPEQISLKIDGKDYFGNYLVIALGTELKVENNLDQYGFNFYSFDGANSFYEKLKSFNGGKIIVLISSLPFKCPAAPYESAMLIESYIRKKGLRDKTEISVYTPEPFPLPVAGKLIGEAVKSMLKNKNINYFPEHQFISATDKTLSFNNGNTADYDLLAFTPKHSCPNVFSQSSVVGKSGWIEVNKHTLETNYPNVYAIGDITSIPLEMGKPLPKAGVFAHYQAEIVAHNIAEKINGKQNFKTFDGYGECFLELGDGIAGYAKGNFYASPTPAVEIKRPSIWRHWGKVWFEKYWWLKYF
jgi:sulfide:quinone oxidoreductase